MTTHQFIPSKTTVTTTNSIAPVRGGLLQRKCGCGGSAGPTGECEACRKKRQAGGLQRMYTPALSNNHDPLLAPSIAHEVLRSPGRPLDAATLAVMEPRFGHDFSNVRIHTDAQAAASARAVNALAYTVGSDVVFDTGQYAPELHAGRKILAHELTHVVQQGSMAQNTTNGLTIGDPDDRHEQQARQMEQMVSQNVSRSVTKETWNQAQAFSHPGQLTAMRLQRLVNPNFVSCNPPSAAIAAITGNDPVGTITTANARAIELLSNAIDELQFTRNNIIAGAEATFPTISDGVAQALQDRFHMDASDRGIWTGRGEGSVQVLIRRFQGARQILADGAMRYQCLGGAAVNFTFGGINCAGAGCTGATRAVSCEGVSRLVLCAPFWSDSADDQASTLMHECFHVYFGIIGDTGNLTNAHCYEQFVSDFNGVAIPAIFVGSCP